VKKIRRKPVERLKRKLGDRREVHAPRKEPQEMEQPKIKSRNRIIVTRIAEVQKAEQLFVDEEKPEKAVVLSRAAVQPKIKVGRVAQRGENVPGRRDQQSNQRSAEWMKSLPRPRGK
jgi:hypothetical protein